MTEFFLILGATIGGAIVFLGLILEKISEAKSERHSPTYFKSHKRLGDWGWGILMLGIAIEIGLGGWFAAREYKVERETEVSIAEKQPADRHFSPAGSNYLTAQLRAMGKLNVKLIIAMNVSREGNIFSEQLSKLLQNAGCKVSGGVVPRRWDGVILVWDDKTGDINMTNKYNFTSRFMDELHEKDANEFWKWANLTNGTDLEIYVGLPTLH